MTLTHPIALAPALVAPMVGRNQLLAALGPEDFALLSPHLGESFLERGSVLQQPGAMIERVYFPHGGLISLAVSVPEGHVIDTTSIGREGAIGLMAGLGTRNAINSAIVQLPGRAAHISAARFAEAAAGSAQLRQIIVRYTDTLLAQVQQVVVCNTVHRLEERLCRWLLHASDRVGDTLAMTQEHLAALLGVQRTTVTMICRKLQLEGVIGIRRGRMTIMDVAALEKRACSCVHIVRRLVDRCAHASRH
jgi:CRP-like cAMP-binding protein